MTGLTGGSADGEVDGDGAGVGAALPVGSGLGSAFRVGSAEHPQPSSTSASTKRATLLAPTARQDKSPARGPGCRGWYS